MPIRCVILDFDGTFTDVDAEAEPFVEAYRSDLADLLGRDVEAAWAEAHAVVAQAPHEHGWKEGGRIVAPALADPYILCTVLGRLVLDRFGAAKDESLRSEILQLFYRRGYPKTKHAFRPHATEVIDALLAEFPGRVFVVTNSNPDTVRGKLNALSAGLSDRLPVEGNARKFLLASLEAGEEGAEEFASLPAERWVDTLPGRPILVKRGYYFRILRMLLTGADVSPDECLVCGDIYELDLGLPEAMGCSVHLMTRPSTPGYELDAAKALGARGGVGDDLRSILARI
ncbi:MAG: HAD family hydrolase [Candidatus Eisenbacteria bacterium]